ncbi:MAG: class I SAM-dependent methyltransferase [Patescibacteria group bacterium]|nr:class I SAM-dependent methyltransferase [Patescibacteria group bacterium]
MTQYKKIAKAYTSKERMENPLRKFIIYPSWLGACGDVKGKTVLDLGCGGGGSSRMLAIKGAAVIGVDKEPEMIKIAQRIERKNPMGIKYVVADAEYLPEFQKKFDLITPAYLLHYATSKKELKNYIENIALNLKQGGKMAAINLNPEQPILSYNSSKAIFVSQKWQGKPFIEGSIIEVTLYKKNGAKICSFNCYFWQKQTYIDVMKGGGFSNIQWIKPRINDIGKKVYANWKRLKTRNLVIISATLNQRKRKGGK